MKRSNYLLSIQKLKTINHCKTDSKSRLLLLDPSYKTVQSPMIQELLASIKHEFVEHEIELDYDFYSADQILHSILPDNVDVPCAFETIGHIGNFLLFIRLYCSYKRI